MKEKDFLSIIRDKKNRKYPLSYKHVSVVCEFRDFSRREKSVFISKQQDALYWAHDYYKPISKLLE